MTRRRMFRASSGTHVTPALRSRFDRGACHGDYSAAPASLGSDLHSLGGRVATSQTDAPQAPAPFGPGNWTGSFYSGGWRRGRVAPPPPEPAAAPPPTQGGGGGGPRANPAAGAGAAAHEAGGGGGAG